MSNSEAGNMVPTYYISMLEVKLGIVLACGPAIRQFWAYRTRTKTSLPSQERQEPNEDFVKMRRRINLRDIFWYRKAQMVGNRVFDASQIFRSQSPPPDAEGGDAQGSSKVTHSALDTWEKRLRRMFPSFGGSRDHTVPCLQGPHALSLY